MTDKYTSYLLHSVSIHVCLYNLQLLYSKRSRYFSQASLPTHHLCTARSGNSLLNEIVTCCLHPVCSCVKLQSKETYGIYMTDMI